MKALFSITLIFLLGCSTNTQSVDQQSNEQGSEEPKIIKSEKSPIIEQTEESLPNEQLDFAEFVFLDEPDGSQQTLEVTWLTKDTIQWKIFAESMLCTYEQYGRAILKQGAKVDEDENGVSYSTSEYGVVDAVKLVSIRIREPERDKAKIIYLHDQPRDECDPFDEHMRRTPSNKR